MRVLRHSTIAAALVLLFSVVMLGSTWVGLAQQQTTIHVVQFGETLASIAEQYDISVNELASVNMIDADSVVFVGQQLVIPLDGGSSSGGGSDQPVATNTPRGSTAANVDENLRVQDAPPTIPPPTPTPLYDPDDIVTILSPSTDQRLIVGFDPVPVIGVVQFDPETMLFWKFELKGSRGLDRIGTEAFSSVPAGGDWVTAATRVDRVINGQLGVIPGFPTLNESNWRYRIVVVSKDGTFVEEPVEVPFSVRPDVSPVGRVEITSPVADEIVQQSAPVRATVNLNQFASNYRVEILGGPYTSWTQIFYAANDVAHPTRVTDTALFNLPPNLPRGRYQIRLIVAGLDGQNIIPPDEVEFGIGSLIVSNLPEVSFSSPRDLRQNNRMVIDTTTAIIGSVNVPDENGYFKLEIRDADRLDRDQEARFMNWTTLGDVHYGGVEDETIGVVSGPPDIAPGSYKLRVVIVNSNNEFSNVREFDLSVRAPRN